MKLFSLRNLAVVGFGAGSALTAAVACSNNSSSNELLPGMDSGRGGESPDSTTSGSSGGSSGAGSSDDGGSGTDATLVMYDGPPPTIAEGGVGCSTPDGLPIKFNPVYSGYDGVHNYQVPVFVEGVDPGSVTWGSSDPSMVSLQPYVAGIMITTRKAGDVTIVAQMGSKCGSAPLHITAFTPQDWTTGSMRYNNGNPLNFDYDAAGISPSEIPDAAFDASGFDASGFDACALVTPNPFENPPAACTNCHGDMSNGKLFGMTLFSDVQHTPEQTGGFSDDQLINVFVNGTVPPGGYFNTTLLPYCDWHQFHTWRDISTPAEQTGMLSYLRSLTPQEQVGCLELFDLMMCADGG
jgi:hypothetical protein